MAMFSKKEALGFGWGKVKAHFWFFVGLILISVAVEIGPRFLLPQTDQSNFPILLLIILVSLILWVVKTIMDLGFIGIALKLHDNQPASYKDLLAFYHLFWRYLGGSILYGMIMMGGILLLIIPGIIWALRFQYYSYFIVDKGLGPVEALKQSWQITKGNTINLFLFNLLALLVTLAGALALLIGLLATIPTTMMAQAYVFRKLQSNNTSPLISSKRVYLMAALGILIFIVPVILLLIINPTEQMRKAQESAKTSNSADINPPITETVNEQED